jgi:AraC family transcriptional regulator of adaptative response/methylated-DNA-[protein]-cysteine methyltransferase
MMSRWKAVMGRDARRDGEFVYAVLSTGIYCRPSCPSRRPDRSRVLFFEDARAAEREGFRACRRCGFPKIDLVGAAARLLVSGPVPLRDLAARVGCSPFHLARAFKAGTGITPRQYGDAMRLARLKRRLRDGGRVTDALYDAGYGSSSRLYERVQSRLGTTPGRYRKGGEGMSIRYTIAPSPLGRLLVAATDRGVCGVSLGGGASWLRSEYPRAEIRRDDAGMRRWLRLLRGGTPRRDLPLDVQATAFQRRVWDELRKIPRGTTRTYSEVARRIGRPRAARAVARACATNPVALAVPCHRVVRADGGAGGYRWGLGRKRLLLEKEKD